LIQDDGSERSLAQIIRIWKFIPNTGGETIMAVEKHESQDWSALYKVGALSAAAIVLIYFIEMAVMLIFGLPPESAQGWFEALQKSRLIGLVQTFALDIPAEMLHVVLLVALFFLLRQARKLTPLLVLAGVFALVGFAVYFASNITFSMLFLSDQFASALSEAQRSQLLTSGQTLLAVYNGSGPFVAFFLLAVSGILVSIAMGRSQVFARWVAIVGIVGYTLELGLPPSIDPVWFLQVDPILIGLGGVLLILWYVAIAVKFIQRSR
jgi:hypothetical protein